MENEAKQHVADAGGVENSPPGEGVLHSGRREVQDEEFSSLDASLDGARYQAA